MPVYVVRLSDGSCLIGEADSESQAREDFISGWEDQVPGGEFILSVRELPRGAFLSRWWPAAEPCQLEGVINDNSDVYEKEYPAINAVFKRHDEEVTEEDDAAEEVLSEEALEERELRLEKKIEEAVQSELRRGNPLTDSVQ